MRFASWIRPRFLGPARPIFGPSEVRWRIPASTTLIPSRQIIYQAGGPHHGESGSTPEEQFLREPISCTVINDKGRIVSISQKVGRRTFLQQHHLHPRDLRVLDSAKGNFVASILVRKENILVSMLELRAVIAYDKVIIFDAPKQQPESVRKLGLLVYDLENKLSSPKLDGTEGGFSAQQSYEMKALESILMHGIAGLELELQSRLDQLNSILRELEDHVDRDLLRNLLVRNKSMVRFHQKCQQVQIAIEDLLENDEALVGMYLTERHQGVHRELDDHAEAELLLETYYNQCNEIIQQAEQVIGNVKNTEDIINIMLDANRNSLMLMELKVTIGTLGFTIGMFFTALYGMNLLNFIEESDYGLAGVTAVTVVIASALTWYNFRKLSSIRRITMTGLSPKTPLADSRGYRKSLQARRGSGGFSGLFSRRRQSIGPTNRALMWRWLVDKRSP